MISRTPRGPFVGPRAARSLRTIIVVVLLTGLPLGCGRVQSTGQFGAAPDRGIRVEVANLHWRDVTIYATRGSARQRLGLVTSNSTRSFSLTTEFVAGGYTVSLFADVVGSDDSLRPIPVTVSPGDVIVWRLRPALAQSDISVRSGGGDASAGDTLWTRPVSPRP